MKNVNRLDDSYNCYKMSKQQISTWQDIIPRDLITQLGKMIDSEENVKLLSGKVPKMQFTTGCTKKKRFFLKFAQSLSPIS